MCVYPTEEVGPGVCVPMSVCVCVYPSRGGRPWEGLGAVTCSC